MSKGDIDFSVTYDPQYRWWSVGCGECGESVVPGRTEVGANERPPFGCCLLIWDGGAR